MINMAQFHHIKFLYEVEGLSQRKSQLKQKRLERQRNNK